MPQLVGKCHSHILGAVHQLSGVLHFLTVHIQADISETGLSKVKLHLEKKTTFKLTLLLSMYLSIYDQISSIDCNWRCECIEKT